MYKKKRIRRRKRQIRELNIDFNDIWEPIYLVLLATFVGMRFLLSTMFTIYWPEYFYRTLLVIGITLVMLHLMTVKDMKKTEIAAMAVVAFVFMMSHYVSGYDFLVDLLILILGAYRVDFENILKTYLAVWTVLMAITIVGALTGAAENLVYVQGENGERVRMALGICYPTDFAAYVAFMMFAYVCLRDKYITYIELAIIAVIAGVVYWITDARTDFIVMEMLVVVVLLAKKNEKQFEKLINKKMINIAYALFPILLCIIVYALSIAFDYDNNILVKLNEKMSNRLLMGRTTFDNYSINSFGQYVFEQGSGGHTEFGTFYFFIDSSYLSIGIKYGVVMLSLLWAEFAFTIKKMKGEGKYYSFLVVFMIFIQSVMEHHYIQYWYNPFLLMAFAKYTNGKKCEGNKFELLDLN